MSVVLITRNGLPLLLEQLEAVLSQRWSGRWELVVVDNDSDDGTSDVLAAVAAEVPRVWVVPARGRRSVAHARNVGALWARGRYVAFIDDDDLVGEGWLEQIGTAVEEHQYVSARIDLDRLNHPHLARSRPGLTGREVGRIDGVPMPAGASIAVRRDWFLSVGGADETFTRGAEDLDWAVRFHLRYGVEPVRCDGAVYHVRLRADPRSALSQGVRYGRAYVQLFATWRTVLTRPPVGAQLRVALGRGLMLLAWVPRSMASRPQRTHLAFEIGRLTGRVVGSIEQRCFFL